MGLVFAVCRMVLAVALLALALLTLVPVPLAALWKPAVAATEWGAALAGLGLLLVFSIVVETRWPVALGIAAGAIVLFLSPSLRAHQLAATLPASFEAAFGPIPEGVAWDRDTPFDPRAQIAPVPWPVPTSSGTYADRAGGLAYDLYRGEGQGPRPVIVAIHGGSWQTGDRTQLAGWWTWLASRGWTVVAIDHRKAPQVHFPDIRLDVNQAIDFVRSHADELGVDPSRLVLYGRSSGGHLALHAAYSRPRGEVAGVVAWYAPTDLSWSWEHPTNPLVLPSQSLLFDLMDGSLGDAPAAYRHASPIELVEGGAPRTLLLTGGRDELVFAEQSHRLAERLNAAHVAHLVVELPWATHGCDANLSGPSGQVGRWAIERFLGTLVAPPQRKESP